MKIALCQINPTVGAFKKNKDLILRNYMESIDNGTFWKLIAWIYS